MEKQKKKKKKKKEEEGSFYIAPASEVAQLINIDVTPDPAVMVLGAHPVVSQLMEECKNSIAVLQLLSDEEWVVLHPTIFCGNNHLTMMHRLNRKGDDEAELRLWNGNTDVAKGVIKFNWRAFNAARLAHKSANCISASDIIENEGFFKYMIHPCINYVKDPTSGAVLIVLILKPWWRTEANRHFMIVILNTHSQDCTSEYLKDNRFGFKHFNILYSGGIFEESYMEMTVKKVATEEESVKYHIREGYMLVEIRLLGQRPQAAMDTMDFSPNGVMLRFSNHALKSVDSEEFAGHAITKEVDLYYIHGKFRELDDALEKNGNLSYIVRLPENEWGIISPRVKVKGLHCVKAFKLKETDDRNTAKLLPWDAGTSNITSSETMQCDWAKLKLSTEASVPASEIVGEISVFEDMIDVCEILFVEESISVVPHTMLVRKVLRSTKKSRRFMIKILDQNGRDCTSANLNGRKWLHVEGGDQVFGEHYTNVFVKVEPTEEGHRMHNGYAEVEMTFLNQGQKSDAEKYIEILYKRHSLDEH